jgi:predicted HicB family RNase H-like nuclease
MCRISKPKLVLESPESALLGIREVVSDVVHEMGKNKEEIPSPIANINYSGKFLVRIPPEIHRTLAIQAAEAGVSLNRMASTKLSQ